MIAHKRIDIIVSTLVIISLCFCLCAMAFADELVSAAGGSGVKMKYEAVLFDTDEAITINILIDEDEWQNMLDNAINEEYVCCDVEINGETIKNVGIRPKGNTSLTSIVNDPDSDRYSFKLEFDKYIEGQTCMGLDKLVLNNNYADATNMKEALVYDMYSFLGADASLYNYAEISVNGEYWGIYLALEAVEESFLLRNYGTESGNLYKPESMGINDGDNDFEDAEFPQRDGENMMPFEFVGDDFDKGAAPFEADGDDVGTKSDDGEVNPQLGSVEFPTGKPGGGNMPLMGGMSMSGGGADLNYVDDDLGSYSTIWDGEVTDSSKKDHKRVIEALKNISEGNDIEKYMDVDNLLKYMAVHTFVVNDDSLSGTMAHNYYLYEYNGKLNIIPWDYNLAFGGMNGGDASAVINDAVDTPFTITDFFDELLENEEYLAQYHEYLRQLAQEYVSGGALEEFYLRTRAAIDEAVKNDPTAFYTYEEYNAAAEMLMKTVKLRAESVSGQLDGSIPSTDERQRSDADDLIDASDIDLSVMGTMNGSGGQNAAPRGFNPKE